MQAKKFVLLKTIFLILLATLAFIAPAWASDPGRVREDSTDTKVTVTVLYNFGGKDGDLIYPAGPIVAQGRDGRLYGTTEYGGTYNDGVVFAITPGGDATVLYQVDTNDGSNGLTLGTDGNLYGTTVYGGIGGGYGTVFTVTPTGELTALYDFSGDDYDAYPDAPPIEAADGNFYGTTLGGFNGDGGEVYKMTPSGDEAPLFKFDRTDGANPGDPLIQATDGSFYGTTQSGGASGRCEQYGCGTVFKLTPKGALTVLHSFNVQNFDCYYPAAPLIEGDDGELYGTVPRGGPKGYGCVFRISRTGKYKILHSFSITDGETPQTALVQATDGNFYGTTEGGGKSNVGTVFKITRSGTLSVLHSFDTTTGAYPSAGLIQHTDGKLYGFAGQGGTYNYGTFYSVDIGLQPFASLVSTSGRIGKSIGILGQGMTGTTSVSFNGTSAKFNVVSDSYLRATVPDGATTGFVTVTTPDGGLKSNKKFRVTQ
jgi:uncharacterized repeat protein (TIGR03803 family)